MNLEQKSAALLLFLCASVSWAYEGRLEDEVEKILSEEGLTGAAWMLFNENSEPGLGAAGLSDNENKTRFITDTRFHVGTVTKSLLS